MDTLGHMTHASKPTCPVSVIGHRTLALVLFQALARFCHGEDSTASPNQAQDTQPQWESLLGMGSPRLTQGFRYDTLRQYRTRGSTLEGLGMGKGLELIVGENTEIQVGVPAYEWQGQKTPSGGWGDDTLLGRYRFLSANEESGNYIASGSLGIDMPVGGRFSAGSRFFTPTLAGGKGWGTQFEGFSIQSALSATIPDGRFAATGIPVTWTTTLQGHVHLYLWPEIEAACTHWYNGPYEGNGQVLLTYGLVFGRFELGPETRLSLGIGYQVPVVSSFNTPDKTWLTMSKLSW